VALAVMGPGVPRVEVTLPCSTRARSALTVRTTPASPGCATAAGRCTAGTVRDGMGSLRTCPTCRAVIGVSAQEKIRRLRRLVERPPGRHTPVAQCSLGACYHEGTGVVQDPAEAVRWYRLAADQGHSVAQVMLGDCYADGTGVTRDYAEAARWYRLAADQGYAGGQLKLGGCYKFGAGVAQDSAAAARWVRLAADQGDAAAQFHLGKCYADGAGVAKDDAEAVRWYRLAAGQGHADAQAAIARHRV
jgi:TPR repeat protein